jgi:hypothetical protein
MYPFYNTEKAKEIIRCGTKFPSEISYWKQHMFKC